MNYYISIVNFLFNIIYYDINFITNYYDNERFPVTKLKKYFVLDLFVLDHP